MRATKDWEAEPDAAALAKFRNANRGAPQVLIVSSSNGDGSTVAGKLGYADCSTDQGGLRELTVCRIRTKTSAARD